MVYSGTEEGESVAKFVSESEMLLALVIWNGEDIARNISEGIKYYKVRRLEKIEWRNIINRIITYLIENFGEK